MKRECWPEYCSLKVGLDFSEYVPFLVYFVLVPTSKALRFFFVFFERQLLPIVMLTLGSLESRILKHTATQGQPKNFKLPRSGSLRFCVYNDARDVCQ